MSVTLQYLAQMAEMDAAIRRCGELLQETQPHALFLEQVREI